MCYTKVVAMSYVARISNKVKYEQKGKETPPTLDVFTLLGEVLPTLTPRRHQE